MEADRDPLRPPPLVISVPPPPSSSTFGFVATMMIAGSLIGAAALVKAVLSDTSVALIVLVALAVYLLVGILAWRWKRWNNRGIQFDELTEAAKLARLPPVAAALRNSWHSWMGMVAPGTIYRIWAAHAESHRDRAVVLYVAPVEPPPTGDFRFEPVIIGAARMVGRGWRWRLIVFCACVVLVLTSTFFMPTVLGLFRVPLLAPYLGSLTGPVIGGAALTLVVLWRSLIRPRYLRLAPGMIQVIRYSWFGKGKPAIRWYSLEPGTLALVVQPKAGPLLPLATGDATSALFQRGLRQRIAAGTAIVLAQGGMVDLIDVGRMDRPDEALAAFWQAILSTAPTPALSDEELVG